MRGFTSKILHHCQTIFQGTPIFQSLGDLIFTIHHGQGPTLLISKAATKLQGQHQSLEIYSYLKQQ